MFTPIVSHLILGLALMKIVRVNGSTFNSELLQSIERIPIVRLSYRLDLNFRSTDLEYLKIDGGHQSRVILGS